MREGGNIYRHREGWLLLVIDCARSLRATRPRLPHMPGVGAWEPAGQSVHILREAAGAGGRAAVSLPEHIPSVF